MKRSLYFVGFFCLLLSAVNWIEKSNNTDSNLFPSKEITEVLKGDRAQSQDRAFYIRDPHIKRIPPPNYIPKTRGHYTREDWQTVIDATWGDGDPATTKNMVWLNFWNTLDHYYACFQGLSPNVWDSIYTEWNPILADPGLSISRGAFCAIMQRICAVLEDSHMYAEIDEVYYTELLPGVPLMVVGNNELGGQAGHFGAGLTPLPDSSALVYSVVESHPLGLVPGDIVLGYDGIPWKELYKTLIDAGLPFTGFGYSSPEPARTYHFLASVGMNWHLFDIIDIVKYDTDDTVHLSTGLLVGQEMSLLAGDFMEIPGVPIPDFLNDEIVSYGTVDATNISYVYSLSFYLPTTSATSIQFSNAISNAMYTPDNTGMILDFRTNGGGWINSEQAGLELLFGNDTAIVWFDRRNNLNDHMIMGPTDRWVRDYWKIYGNNSHYYNKPIAVLTGPKTASMGEFASLQLAHHPMAKVFGKCTSGAINIPEWPQPELHTGWYFNYAENNTYLEADPGNYISRLKFPSLEDHPGLDYEEVWFTKEGVANGHDDVVEAAIAWILSRDLDQDGLVNENDNCPEMANNDQSDIDSDDIGDVCDNCPDDYNPNQEDTDLDNIGDVCEWVCGDVDGQEGVNILDIVYLINYIYKNGPAPDPPDAADVDGLIGINILDIVYLINYKYKDGPEPNCN